MNATLTICWQPRITAEAIVIVRRGYRMPSLAPKGHLTGEREEFI